MAKFEESHLKKSNYTYTNTVSNMNFVTVSNGLINKLYLQSIT